MIPERDVPVPEYAIDGNVESRDWLFPNWNIYYMSIIMYNYFNFLMNMYAYTRRYKRVYIQTHIQTEIYII